MAGCPSGSRESSAKGMSASSNLVPASLFFYGVIVLPPVLVTWIPGWDPGFEGIFIFINKYELVFLIFNWVLFSRKR